MEGIKDQAQGGRMLLKMARLQFMPFPPDARCCYECANGERTKREPSNHTLTCKVDGSLTLYDYPGYCDHFTENKRRAQARRRKSAAQGQ
jgi:hypothetical protein